LMAIGHRETGRKTPRAARPVAAWVIPNGSAY
jgi:hypothetical protein